MDGLQENGSGGHAPPGFVSRKVLTRFAEHQLPEIMACLNVNIRRSGIPRLKIEPEHDGTLVISGGGPSLKQTWPRIAALKERGASVFAMNDAALYLDQKGVGVDGCVVWETSAVPQYVAVARYPVDTTYYIMSRAHPDWFCMLREQPIVMWHLYPAHGEEEIIEEFDSGPVYIAGGTTAALRTLEIGRALGFRNFHLFGCDASCEGSTHAYYDHSGGKTFFDAWAGGRVWHTKHSWAQQAIDLCNQVRAYDAQREKHGTPFSICVHGDGLLPAMARDYGIPVCP